MVEFTEEIQEIWRMCQKPDLKFAMTPYLHKKSQKQMLDIFVCHDCQRASQRAAATEAAATAHGEVVDEEVDQRAEAPQSAIQADSDEERMARAIQASMQDQARAYIYIYIYIYICVCVYAYICMPTMGRIYGYMYG